MIPQDWQEYATYVDSFKKRSERCQCESPQDAGGLTCPGPTNCPYSDVEQGEESECNAKS